MIDHFKSRWNGTVIRRISEGNHGWIIQWPRWPRVQVHRYRYWRMSTGILVWIQYLIDILYCYFFLWAVLDSYLVYIPPKKSHSTVELYWVDWHGSCCPKYGCSWMFSVLGIKLFQRVPIYRNLRTSWCESIPRSPTPLSLVCLVS